MKLLLVGVLLLHEFLTASAALSIDPIDELWNNFKKTHDRIYKSENEEAQRRGIFADKLAFIVEHNIRASRGEHSYRLGINHLADWTDEEVSSKLMMKPQKIHDYVKSFGQGAKLEYNVADLPATVNWTAKGVVTPVKDQGNCGSCWIFAAIASLESIHALKPGSSLVSLSEQNALDCVKADGCQGGLPTWVYDYITKNKGIDTEDSYPYEGRQSKCRFNESTVGATVQNANWVSPRTEEALQAAVANIGPISAVVVFNMTTFGAYHDGVYHDGGIFDPYKAGYHVMAVVGYGTLKGEDYWIVKNSWGERYGMNGYILMSRNQHNECGIASAAAYPIV